MSSLLTVRNLSMSIDSEQGEVRPLASLNFEIAKGETFVLLGESGCGKSMTALSLMRLLPDGGRITAGSVTIEGQELLGLTEAEMQGLRGGKLAMIFQEPGTSLNPVLSIGSQLGEVLRLHRGMQGEAAMKEAERQMQIVGIPDPARRLGEYPFQLSGGMKQRVMIAMALAGNPQLLIADEPTTALDVTIQAQVLKLLAELQKLRGMGMLLITHDLGVVAEVADRIGLMYAGELIEIATREEFFRAPAHPYSRKLFEALPEGTRDGAPLATIPGRVPPLTQVFTGCRFADRCEHALAHCKTEIPEWHHAPNGQQVRCHLFDAGRNAKGGSAETAPKIDKLAEPQSVPPYEDTPLLEVRNLKVHFPIRAGLLQRTVGHVRAVDGVSLALRAGKTLALVGESGCGKTTLGRALLNLVPASGGELYVQGKQINLDDRGAWQPLRKLMQMVFQDPFGSLNPRLRVGEIIEEGLAALAIETDAAKRHALVAKLLEQVGLAPAMADRYPHEFSGGQRQRVALARALAVNPRLIICDEPTSALDVSVQAQVLNLMRELQARMGLAYLFITHNIGVVEYLADEVAVMYLGRIVEYGAAEAVLQRPQHPYTQALLAAAPRLAERAHKPAPLSGDIPSPSRPPAGCHFHTRCPRSEARCLVESPVLAGCESGQQVACHFVRQTDFPTRNAS